MTIWTQTPPRTFPMSLVTQLTQKPVLRIKNMPKIDVFPVFFTKSGAPLLIQCGLIVKTLNRDISKTRRSFYDLIKVLDVSRNACSTEHRMRKSYFWNFCFDVDPIELRDFDEPHGSIFEIFFFKKLQGIQDESIQKTPWKSEVLTPSGGHTRSVLKKMEE